MSIKIVYNSPAVPQGDYNFTLKKVYECEKIKNEYIVKAEEDKKFSLAFLKSIFKPCDGYSWDMLEEKKDTEVKATKKVAKSTKNK